MPSIILILMIVLAPLIMVGCLVTAGYKTLRDRRGQVDDIERARNLNYAHHVNDHTVVLRELKQEQDRHGKSLPPNLRGTVLEHVPPIANPLPNPKVDIKGTGGGFVQYYEATNNDTSHRVQETNNNDYFENEDLYGEAPEEYKRGELAQPGSHTNHADVCIPAPKPVYADANYGRWNTSERPTTLIYEDDVKAADAWEIIEKREPLVRHIRDEATTMDKMVRPVKLSVEEFEHVDLGGESGEWRQGDSPESPLPESAAQKPLSRLDQVAQRMAEAKRLQEEKARREEDEGMDVDLRGLAGSKDEQDRDTNAQADMHASDQDIRTSFEQSREQESLRDRIRDGSATTYASTNSPSRTSFDKALPPVNNTGTTPWTDIKQANPKERRSSIRRSNISASHSSRGASTNVPQRSPATHWYSSLASHPYGSRTSIAESGMTSFDSSDTSFEPSFQEKDINEMTMHTLQHNDVDLGVTSAIQIPQRSSQAGQAKGRYDWKRSSWSSTATEASHNSPKRTTPSRKTSTRNQTSASTPAPSRRSSQRSDSSAPVRKLSRMGSLRSVGRSSSDRLRTGDMHRASLKNARSERASTGMPNEDSLQSSTSSPLALTRQPAEGSQRKGSVMKLALVGYEESDSE